MLMASYFYPKKILFQLNQLVHIMQNLANEFQTHDR